MNVTHNSDLLRLAKTMVDVKQSFVVFRVSWNQYFYFSVLCLLLLLVYSVIFWIITQLKNILMTRELPQCFINGWLVGCSLIALWDLDSLTRIEWLLIHVVIVCFQLLNLFNFLIQDEFNTTYKPVIGDLKNAIKDVFKEMIHHNKTLLQIVTIFLCILYLSSELTRVDYQK